MRGGLWDVFWAGSQDPGSGVGGGAEGGGGGPGRHSRRAQDTPARLSPPQPRQAWPERPAAVQPGVEEGGAEGPSPARALAPSPPRVCEAYLGVIHDPPRTLQGLVTKGQPWTQAPLGAEVGWRGRAYASGRGAGVVTSPGIRRAPGRYGVRF